MKPTTSEDSGPASNTVMSGLNVILRVEIISALIYALFYLVLVDKKLFPTQTVQSAYVLWIMAQGTVVFFLWRGYNWARWAMIVWSVLAFCSLFLNITFVSIFPEIERIYRIISGIWTTAVGIWLLLPGVARHFKAPKPI